MLRVWLMLLLAIMPLAAQQPELSAVVGSNFAFYGASWSFIAPGSDNAVVYAMVFYPRTKDADGYVIRATFRVGDERREQIKIVDSATACPTYLNYTPAWPCAAVIILVKGADTLQPVKLLSVAVDSQVLLGRLELKLE